MEKVIWLSPSFEMGVTANLGLNDCVAAEFQKFWAWTKPEHHSNHELTVVIGDEPTTALTVSLNDNSVFCAKQHICIFRYSKYWLDIIK
jgi:hypothetical protein